MLGVQPAKYLGTHAGNGHLFGFVDGFFFLSLSSVPGNATNQC